MEIVDTFYDHLEYFKDIWDILCLFGTFCVYLVHFVFIWYILCLFGTFCVYLVHFVFIWYILCLFGTFCVHLVHFSGFGIMYQEKSGNPVWKTVFMHQHVCDGALLIDRKTMPIF
jgi:hypothetical protein